MQSTTSNGYYYFHCRFLVSNLIVHTDFLHKIFEVAKAFAGVLSKSEALYLHLGLENMKLFCFFDYITQRDKTPL